MKKLDQAIDEQESRLKRIAHRLHGDEVKKEREATESALPFGPFGPDKESPPPSALAARRDVQLSQIVSGVDRGESTSGSRALRVSLPSSRKKRKFKEGKLTGLFYSFGMRYKILPGSEKMKPRRTFSRRRLFFKIRTGCMTNHT